VTTATLETPTRSGSGEDVPDLARVSSEVAAWTQRDLRWEELLEEAARLGPDPAMEQLSDAEVEAAVCDLAAQLAAMTCRWLGYVAEFVVRGIWADQGARTPAQWLSWKAGVAASTAREQVRVALRLRELPGIHEAFAAGRLSYSKVRALTRFAVPELEELLLRWSRYATAAELERIATSFRTQQRRRGSAANVDGSDARYGWTQRFQDADTMVISIRIPVEEGIELRDRLERRLHLAATADHASAETGTAPDGAAGASAEATSGASASAEAGAAGASAEPATGPAGGSADPGRDGRSASAEADDEPPQVLYRATEAELVQELLHTVLAAAADEPADTSGLDRHTLVIQTPHSALADDAAGLVPVHDASGRSRTMSPRVLRKLACEAGIVLATTDARGTPIDLGRRTRRLSAALRRALHLRDRTCTFPGCHTTRNLHAHHVWHWADGGPTDLANLVLLCANHHRFVHDHVWTIEVAAGGGHRFTPPDGEPVPRSDQLEAGPAGLALVDPGPRPTDALRPDHWDGPRSADYDFILTVLEQEFTRLVPDLITRAA
jgi:hypothetical protein